MQILHFIRKFSSWSETFIYDLIVSLQKSADFQNRAVTFERHLAEERPFPATQVVPGLTIPEEIWYRICRRFSHQAFPSRHAVRLRKFGGLFREYIVHAHFGYAGRDILQAFPSMGIARKMIVSLHGTDTTRMMRVDAEARRTLLDAAAEGCMFAVNSDYLGEKCRQAGVPESNLRLLRNGVGRSFFDAERKLPYQKPGPLRVVSVGRLIDWKGHEFLVRALKALKDSMGAVHLTIAGDGPRRKDLETLAADIGVRQNVDLLGVVPHQNIPGLLSTHHIYVQPSATDETTGQEESFGLAILEALAVGLPVVVTRSGGIPEAVGGKSAQGIRIVPQRDPAAIADAVRELCADEHSFDLDWCGRRELLETYTRERQLTSLTSIYRELRAR